MNSGLYRLHRRLTSEDQDNNGGEFGDKILDVENEAGFLRNSQRLPVRGISSSEEHAELLRSLSPIISETLQLMDGESLAVLQDIRRDEFHNVGENMQTLLEGN